MVYFGTTRVLWKSPALKTRAELKAEARETRKLEKERKSRTPHLSSRCRAVNAKKARKRLTLEARARIAETKRSPKRGAFEK